MDLLEKFYSTFVSFFTYRNRISKKNKLEDKADVSKKDHFALKAFGVKRVPSQTNHWKSTLNMESSRVVQLFFRVNSWDIAAADYSIHLRNEVGLCR